MLEYLWGGEGPLVHLGLVQSGTQLMLAPWCGRCWPGWGASSRRALASLQPCRPSQHNPPSPRRWIIGLVALFVANGLGLFSAIGRGDDEAY